MIPSVSRRILPLHRSSEKDTIMRNINLHYVNEAYDEDGVLSSFEVSCPASFNFGYDVVD